MTHTEVNLGILNRDQMMAVIILMTRRLQAAYAAVGETVADNVLQAWLDQHPGVCVVDPFQNTAKVRGWADRTPCCSMG